MSKKDVEASIQGFYDALMNKDLEGLLSFCTEDAILMWASFTFKGREEIKRWAMEFGEHFTKLTLENISIVQAKDYTIHRFNITITLPDERKGWAPGVGRYEFKNGKFQRIWIDLFRKRGRILIKRRDLPLLVQAR